MGLPKPSGPHPLTGLCINSYTVGDWCPTPDGTGPAEAVGLSLNLTLGDLTFDVVMRLKTPAAVDTMIQSLLRHKRSVWPNAK